MIPFPHRRTVSAAILSFISICGSFAEPFTEGNIAVLRFQDDLGTLTNRSARLFVDEYTTTGNLVQSIAIPTHGPNAFTVSGYSSAEGALARTPNGRWIIFAGYNVGPDYTNVTESTAVAVPRALGVLDVFGDFSIAAKSTEVFSGNSIRAAMSDGTNNFWGVGAVSSTSAGGIVYFGFNSAPGEVLSGNTRVINIFNGSIYYSLSGTNGVRKLSGLPRASTTGTTVLPIAAGSSPYAFAMNPAGDTMYVADDRQNTSGGVQRWSFNGSSWVLNYTLASGSTNAGARGLAVDWSGINPVIYATASDNTFFGNPGNRLIRIVDTGPASSATTLATCGMNSSFRGVSFVPIPTGPVSKIDPNYWYWTWKYATPDDNPTIGFVWLGVGGSNYVIQALDTWTGGFSDISPVITLPGNGIFMTNFSDLDAPTNINARFYRIRSH